MQNHNDTIITTQEDFFINICTSHFICKSSKRLFKVCVWERSGDRTELQYFDPHSYGRQRCVFLVLQMLNRRPRGPLCWVMAFFTASYQRLPWTPTHQGPKAPSAWCGFPYHISSLTPSDSNCNSSVSPRAPSAWCSFPYHISSITPSDL